MDNQIKMCWIDLETTGLDARLDVPLEVGIKLTDEYGYLVAKRSWLVLEDTQHFASGIARGVSNKVVNKMHTENNLWADLDALGGYPISVVDRLLVNFLDTHDVLSTGLPMCGNSIGSLDRPFCLNYFPKFNAGISYRNVDMSSIKEIVRMVNPVLAESLKLIVGTKADTKHRALDDIDASITEYRAYLNNFFILGA